MPRVIHFEICADDPERALGFYQEVFGWKSQKWDGTESYWLLATGDEGQPGINGGLMKRADNPLPPSSATNTIEVPSVDEYAQSVAAHGGKVVMPKCALPGIGYLAYCADTEGNVFGIMQPDAEAKL